MATFTCTEVTFRPLRDVDLPMLVDWLSRDHVVEWWAQGRSVPTIAAARAKYLPRLEATSPVKPYLASLAGKDMGFIQSYVALDCGEGWWEQETDPGVRGIDQFLADGDNLGQGLGTRMVSAFVRRLLAEPGVTAVQTDPHPNNARAIRCYVKSGFAPVRTVITPDGPALLMVAVGGRLPDATRAA